MTSVQQLEQSIKFPHKPERYHKNYSKEDFARHFRYGGPYNQIQKIKYFIEQVKAETTADEIAEYVGAKRDLYSVLKDFETQGIIKFDGKNVKHNDETIRCKACWDGRSANVYVYKYDMVNHLKSDHFTNLESLKQYGNGTVEEWFTTEPPQLKKKHRFGPAVVSEDNYTIEIKCLDCEHRESFHLNEWNHECTLPEDRRPEYHPD